MSYELAPSSMFKSGLRLMRLVLLLGLGYVLLAAFLPFVSSLTRLHRVIADRHNVMPQSTQIGFALEADRKHYKTTKSGLVVLPRDQTGGKSALNIRVSS